MLRNRHDRTDRIALAPPLGLRFETQLEQLDCLLNDDELVELVRGDLTRRHPKTSSRGRPSTPVEVILRMLVVMRLYGWSFEQAGDFVNDSLVLRHFCRVYLEKVPDDTTQICWANTIGPETVERINGRVVQLAGSLKVMRGRKLRVDTTAVETNIHFPTDSGPIGDGVRVVSCLLRHARVALGEAAAGLKEAFRGRIRAVRKLSQQLHKFRLDEVEGGIITGYSALEKADGQDQPHLAESLAKHKRQFSRPPRVLAADRGMSSVANEKLAKVAGIKHVP